MNAPEPDHCILLASLAALATLAALACALLAYRHRAAWHRYVLAGCALVLLALAAGLGAQRQHEGWLHPPFIFDAPLGECQAAGLPLDERYIYSLGDRDAATARFATAHGVPPQDAPCILAVSGHELLRLVPAQWHGSKVSPELRPSDPGRVRFYRLHPRYLSAWGP